MRPNINPAAAGLRSIGLGVEKNLVYIAATTAKHRPTGTN